MTIVVEDGTAKSNSETYLSVVDFKSYADGRGHPYDDFTDLQIEQALRRAATYIDTMSYVGQPVNGREQAMAWPRKYVSGISSSTIPREIKSAQSEATLRELVAPGSMMPDLERGGAVIQKTESVDGVVTESTTYAQGASGSTVFTTIDRMLSGLVQGASGYGVAFLSRA